MPYEAVKRGDKWIVQKQGGGKTFGTHDSKAEADAQLAALYANEPKAMRALHLVGATSGARTEWLGDREYLVVPTVALIGDNVIHAVNAPEAEFVPARILSAEGWERKPLMLGHPTRNGRQISANDPDVLRASSFGFTANPKVNGKRLEVESWCDVKKLEALGQSQLLADLRDKKPIEVSTGSFVETRPASGTMNGKRYATEWTSIGPDHLAFLPGGVGACSIEMGCGAHRAAMRVMEGSDLLEDSDMKSIIDPETLRTLRDIPQSVRDEMKASDFAGPNESFPIKTQADVDAAAHLIGKADNPDKVKANVIKIAKRKGLKIPDAWRAAAALPDKAQTDCPTCDGSGKIRGGNVTCPDCKGKGTMKGASMNIKNLKARILALFGDEAAAAEEAAELVAYNSMRTLFDGVGDQWDAVSGLIDALIADETENPTDTSQQEAAEEQVEDARLDAIRMGCYAMISALQQVCNACTEQQMPDAPEPSDPRYMEMFRAAIGKEISAKNLKVIQAAHDSSHDVHSQTVALGAQCDGMKAMAAKADGESLDERRAIVSAAVQKKFGSTGLASSYVYAQAVFDDHVIINKDEELYSVDYTTGKDGAIEFDSDPILVKVEYVAAAAMMDCPTCDGTGQVKKDGKQQDCPTCGGDGQIRSAEDGGQSAEGGQMTKEQRAAEIKKLVDCPCSGFTAADVKVLEAADDATIVRFRAAADAHKKEIDDLRAAQAKTEADLKAAQAAQIPAEELVQLRALADERKAKDAAEKADIVAKLVPLKTLSKEQLEAKTLDELRTLAAFAKVPTADFSAKGIPAPRAAAQTDNYAPPDPYNLKALQGKKEAVN